MIELLGVMAIVAILAVAVIATVIRRMDHAAKQREMSDLQVMANGLSKYVLTEKRIPETNKLTGAIAKYLDLAPTQVRTTPRGFSRVFMVDPTSNVQGNNLQTFAYEQSNAGWTNPPVNARGLILATIASPPLSGITESFSTIWNTPEGGKPASWTGKADDLLIQRMELGKLFYKLYLLNIDATNYGLYTFETNVVSSVSPNGGQLTAYVFDGTAVSFYGAGVLQFRVIMDRDQSFVYQNNRWSRDLSSGDPGVLDPGSFGDWVDKFLKCGGPGPPFPNNWATPQSIVDQFYTYLWAYAVWSDYSFQGITGTTPQNPLYRVVSDAQVNLSDFSYNIIH